MLLVFHGILISLSGHLLWEAEWTHSACQTAIKQILAAVAKDKATLFTTAST